jgi:hypothetical protein
MFFGPFRGVVIDSGYLPLSLYHEKQEYHSASLMIRRIVESARPVCSLMER